MRILYIIPGFDEGGAEVHVLNLIRELHGRHEITLATCGGKLEAELPDDVKIIHLPVERKNIFTGLYCAGKLKKYDEKARWEIIHAHSRVPAWIAWMLSREVSAKWLMTAHSLYSLNAGLIPLKHADGVICVSEAVRRHLQNHLPRNVITIPNGIIPPDFLHKDFSHEGMNKFLFVGRLTRLKGLDVVLRAMSELKEYAFTLDVVGDGAQRTELEALTRELGLNDRVKFLGAKNREQVGLMMAESSCLVFPSYSEGMGLVVLEALAAGLPVIASDLEALREFASGELVPSGDVGAWREAVREFIAEKKASPLNAGHITTIQEMAEQTENYYARITKNDPA